MGFWRFNPPEPCCNPPAGFCQSVPCRWRFVEKTPLPNFVYFNNHEDVDYFGLVDQQLGLENIIFTGRTTHTQLQKAGIVGEPPPWFRVWTAEVPLTINSEFLEPTEETHVWAFGYWRWVIPGNTALDSNLFDAVGWGFGIHNGSGFSGEAFIPVLPGNVERPLWFFHRGHHDYRFRCWGQNKLIYDGNQQIGGDPFDPDQYVLIEPDL